jgi:hypothetical protein
VKTTHLVTCIACIAAAVMAVIVVQEVKRNKNAINAMPIPIWIERYQVDEILRTEANAVLIRGTGSMRPTIPAGRHDEIVSVAIYEPRDVSLLRVGMPVIFKHVSGLIIHQLAELTSSGWTTTGSANMGYDTGKVTQANLRGVVVKLYNIKRPGLDGR